MEGMSRPLQLPVDAILPEIVASLRRHPCLVIEAPPGAGKTTRVPPALLQELSGEVVVLEPRRIAARMAARRVASEMGEAAGGIVGYQVRFEEASSARTRLRFVTEGVLTRRLLTDPQLRGVDAVILDEFHERHLEGDLALALLRRLRHTRPELRIVVMSATLDAAPIAHFLDDCPVLRSAGRLFELTIEHLPYSPQPLEAQVRGAFERILRESPAGDVLAFLPGAAEIRRAMRACAHGAQQAGWLVLPLHGSLSPQEQDQALAPAGRPKLILSTNVAESSVTVEGVTTVIDSGLARFARSSPWSGLPVLEVGRISQASARQRSGRAGRTAPGRVLRLYTEEDFGMRAAQETPEILRAELSQLCLSLRAMGIGDVTELAWLDAPPAAALAAAESLLERLGATGERARQLAGYPLPPRLARILVEAMARGVGESGCVAAALLGSGVLTAHGDLLTAMESAHDPRLRQHIAQLRHIARPPRQKAHDDDALLISVLAGFPDRVARRRAGTQLLLSNGASAECAADAPRGEFMVAVDAEERSDKPLPLVRMAARLEPEWLIDLFPGHVRERSELNWNRAAERVDCINSLLYDELTLSESCNSAPEPEAAAAMLAQKALETGLARFVDAAALEDLLVRIELAGLAPPDLAQELRELCSGLRSFAELKSAAKNFLSLLEQKAGARRLDELAPSRLRLQGGRQTKVHYERGKPPWIASRLQDFFGMRETPRIGAGRMPVVIHLLAPNQRAVQTTSDLAGFWERLYPQVRRELMRRYPRHSWPEKP
jgi:ATP-dependent helicase HrpB